MEKVRIQSKKMLPMICLFLCFIVMALIPHAWMLSGKTEMQGPGIKFKMQSNFPGYEIETNSITQSVIDILGTTNLFDVKLSSVSEKPFRIFFAQWPKDDKNTLMVLRHTPDMCWQNGGWTFIDVGFPSLIFVEMPAKRHNKSQNETPQNRNTIRIPFECRTYCSPDRGHIETVIWCSVLGGYVIDSSDINFDKENKSKDIMHSRIGPLSLGKVRNNHLFYILKNRINKHSDKQYLRLSMEYNKISDIIQQLKELLVKHFNIE